MQYSCFGRCGFLIVLGTCLTIPGLSQSGVFTKAFTNDRAGANTQETVMTPNLLQTKGLRRITTIPVFGDARGMESQALFLANVKVADGTTHDIAVLPSMANQVRGVDAKTGAAIWNVTLGTPINGGAAIDMHLINDKWGVLSTGVVDPDTQQVYMVAWISTDGTPQNGVHFIYTLNVATGAIIGAPVSLASLKNGTQAYNATMRKQRSSLVMTKINGRKTIFFAYGTVLETGNGAAGGVIAYDVASNAVTAFLPMSQGLGAGIWMGGQGLAADAAGFLYGVTGNGSFNGVNDFGETIFKVQYTPPAAGQTSGSLAVVSHWTPYSDAGRVGLDPTKSGPAPPVTQKLAGESAPEETISRPVNGGMSMAGAMTGAKVVSSIDTQTGAVVPLLYPANPTDPGWNDEDLGSAGCTLIEKYGKLLCSGKDGIGYVVNTANMGNTMPADFADAKANCAKLATPPIWMTASPGPVDPCPQNTVTLNFFPWGKTRHMHMTPVQYMSPTRGMTIFVWGENSQLHAWTMSPTGAMQYLAQGNEVASIESLNSPGGMPGGFCTLSSNGNKANTAILWCSIPYGDANAQITNGRLLAYDPENLIANPDGSKTLRVLWDSQRWGLAYVYNKFMPPVVYKGQVYLNNYNGGVDVYAP